MNTNTYLGISRKAVFTVILSAITLFGFTQTTLISKESTWNYLDNGSNQGTTWIDSNFNDGSWSSGDGIFGYGTVDGASINETLSYGSNSSNKYITTYFRKQFSITNPDYTVLYLNLLCDDGAVIYINGKQAYSYNMPSSFTYTTGASTAISGTDEGDYTSYTITDTFLINGVNTIAVELHNQSGTSSDLGFDLEISAADLGDYIFTAGGEWNYLDNGSDQGTAWYGTSYNDATWNSGDAVLGYGTIDGASISTTLGYGGDASNKYPTTYFRKQVTLVNPDYTQLDLRLLCDDGAAIYINGKLAMTYNMASSWDYSTYTISTAEGSDEGDYTTYSIPDTFLVNGVNTFAVEVHQGNATSSDIGFDLEVIGRKVKYLSGSIYLDMDGNGSLSGLDETGSGAIELKLYYDADSNQVLLPSEAIDSTLSSPLGTFSFTFNAEYRHVSVKMMTEDFDSRASYTTDTVFHFETYALTGDTAYANFGTLGPRSLCLLVADDQNNEDKYFMANRVTGKNQYIGNISGHSAIEAMAIKTGMDSIWVCDAAQFGMLDLATGAFTAIGSGIGNGDGTIGGSPNNYAFSDIDGLAYDEGADVLYGTERRSNAQDLLIAIDRSTGTLIPDFFGSGVDYVEIIGTGVISDIDDIAFNPYTGQLVAINNQNSGDSTRYISINPVTGEGTVLSISGVGDIEGMGYYNTGELYGTTGIVDKAGYPMNTFYSLDRNTGVGTRIDSLYSGAIDVEGCDCLTGPQRSLISGVVFYDNDSSGTYDASIDTAFGDIKVYLYRDVNGNGVIDAGDYKIDSVLTATQTGYYVFTTDSLGDFLTRPVVAGTAFVNDKTTTNDSLTEKANFVFTGSFDGKNDFGFHISAGDPYLPLYWLVVSAQWVSEDAVIEWKTADEVNVSHFVLERKIDENKFSDVDEIAANGNTSTINNYVFIDPFISRDVNQEILYRIKQYDYNGKFSYSPSVMLNKAKNQNVTISPNPFVSSLEINALEVTGDFLINIIDAQGKMVYSETLNLTRNKKVVINNLEQLNKGVYFLNMSGNNKNYSFKLIR